MMSEDVKWITQLMLDRKPLIFTSLDELPDEAANERAYASATGIRSSCIMPLEIGGSVIGNFGFDMIRSHRRWSEEEIERTHTMAELIASALHRKRQHEEIARLQARLEAENIYLREEVHSALQAGEIIGDSPTIINVLRQVDTVAPTEASVLITGETGTGKELVARAIHGRSRRRDRVLVKVDCASLPETLIESALFGHVKGAFTGASRDSTGRFELADRGTIFLDEIGELPLPLQAKLLRVLETGEFEQVGSSKTRTVDVRVIAATNRDLDQALAQGALRRDLFFRLNVFPIHVPPLRERRDDIPLLVWHLINMRRSRLGRMIESVRPDAMASLRAYDWPGNVRELQNVIERALIRSNGPELHLVDALGASTPAGSGAAGDGERSGWGPSQRLVDLERNHILQVLDDSGWKIKGAGNAAERLGLPPSTLRFRMKKLGIERPSAKIDASTAAEHRGD
jgi:transcriptional regulator with GAF, ATPase, and Fis domain